jgi:hypothetical protein
VLIKNLLPHPDDLHDGRPIDAYATAEVTPEDFQLEHYQGRLRDGLLAVVPEDNEPPTVDAIKAAIEGASDDEREAVKAQFRQAEEASARPRQGVLDATKPADKETT